MLFKIVFKLEPFSSFWKRKKSDHMKFIVRPHEATLTPGRMKHLLVRLEHSLLEKRLGDLAGEEGIWQVLNDNSDIIFLKFATGHYPTEI